MEHKQGSSYHSPCWRLVRASAATPMRIVMFCHWNQGPFRSLNASMILSCFSGDGNPLGPEEAAQAVFPAISKPLQKYLRVTRQQPWHSMESIIRHLSACVANDVSPKAFLEKYLATYPMLQVRKPRAFSNHDLHAFENYVLNLDQVRYVIFRRCLKLFIFA